MIIKKTSSVKYLFFILTCSIFVSEALIMLFLDSAILPPMSKLNTALLDATLLLIFNFPVLYFFAFLPQIRTAQMLIHSQAELLRANEKLILKNIELASHTAERAARAVELVLVQVKNTERERRATELAASHEKNTLLNLQVNQMQKLESIGRLTSGIAHDFNNILSCMLGYNEMNLAISDEMQDEALRDELEKNTKQIDSAGQRAVVLIKKMMAYCRQEKILKKSTIQPAQEVIYEVLEMLRPALTHRIKIEFEHCGIENGECDLCVRRDGCHTNIQIDTIDLHQILTNLVVNARDAMKDYSGIITISLSVVPKTKFNCIACAETVEGDFIELSVSDNGSGISPEIIHRLFDPFFTTKPQGEGTGLGLSAVSGLVHQAGGHLLVNSNQSELKHGTAFRLFFPVIHLPN
ncbi:MAG: ATP-binding protein [Methylococcaceae bacterium]